MGFGLMGAGAAVSGLIGGYQQGRRFAREEDEADRQSQRFDMEKERFGLEKEAAGQRKQLTDAQIKSAGLLNKKAEMEVSDAEHNRQVDEADRAILEKFLPQAYATQAAPSSAPAPQGAIADPAADPSVPVQSAPAAGIATPGGSQPVPAGGQTAPPRSRFEILREMNTELLNNQLRKRGVDRGAILKQAIDSARFFSKAETQATVDAMQRFQAGVPQERILADMAAQGILVQPGTSFANVESKDEKTGVSFTDVVISLPNGQKLSQRALARASLDPKDLFNLETEIGKLNATISHHAAVEKLAAEANLDKRLHYAETMKRLDAQIEQQNKLFRLREEEFKENSWDKLKVSAERSFARTFNYTPLDDVKLDRLRREDEDRPINLDAKGKPDPTKKTRVQQYQERIESAEGDMTMAMLTYGLNRDPRTGRPNATEAEVIQALRRAESNRKSVQYDDNNQAFLIVNSNKVLLPMSRPGEPAPGSQDPKTRTDRSRDAGGPVSGAPAPAASPTAGGVVNRGGISYPIEKVVNRGGTFYSYGGKNYATEAEARAARGF